jgi:hypothetical protein
MLRLTLLLTALATLAAACSNTETSLPTVTNSEPNQQSPNH